MRHYPHSRTLPALGGLPPLPLLPGTARRMGFGYTTSARVAAWAKLRGLKGLRSWMRRQSDGWIATELARQRQRQQPRYVLDRDLSPVNREVSKGLVLAEEVAMRWAIAETEEA